MTHRRTKLPVVAAVLLAAACIHGMEKVTLATAVGDTPAAKGTVRTMRASNDTIRLIVDVKHLAPAERAQPGATTYVVWTQRDGSDAAQNVGALDVDKKLKGSMMAYVPYDSFRVFVTAEPRASVKEPTGGELLSANIDESD